MPVCNTSLLKEFNLKEFNLFDIPRLNFWRNDRSQARAPQSRFSNLKQWATGQLVILPRLRRRASLSSHPCSLKGAADFPATRCEMRLF
jgi:hypothetical protein